MGKKMPPSTERKKEMEIYEQKAKHIPAYSQQCRAVKPRVTFLPINLFSWRYCQLQTAVPHNW